MKRITILFFFSTIYLTSCATLFNKNEKKIKVSTDISNAKMKYNDSIFILPTQIYVERKKENLELELITDSINSIIEIPYGLDQKYKYGNLIFTLFAPVGYIVDYTNNKKFTYPNKIDLSLNNEKYLKSLQNKIKKQVKKDSIREIRLDRKQENLFLNVIIPSFHNFNVAGYKDYPFKNGGALGIGAGLDYYYKDDKFLNLEFSLKTNYYDLLISSITIEDSFQIYNFSLTDNYRIKRFEFGYGLNVSYSHLHYNTNEFTDQYFVGDGTQIPINVIKKINYKGKQTHFGISTRAAYQISGIFNVGLFFKPSFFRINETGSNGKFEYIYGLDLRFKLKLK